MPLYLLGNSIILLLFTSTFSFPNDPAHRKLNAVLFFAHPDSSCESLQPEEALKCLSLHEVAKVKPSTTGNIGRPLGFISQRNTMSCKERLKEGITALNDYCQKVLGMKSAIISISEKEITEDIGTKDLAIPPQINERMESISRRTRSKNSKSRDYITSSEHKEVFKIRYKRDLDMITFPPREIMDIPLERQHRKSAWDVLDVVSHVRYSFLDRLFENKTQEFDHDNTPLAVLGSKKEDPALFKTVQSTLSSLQEGGDNFLMVVFGGHLREISNSHSPLIQCIKHVVESTIPEETLIILTGSCPETPRKLGGVVEINENSKLHKLIPVYAKGPGCGTLGEVGELCQVPLGVRTVLDHQGGGANEFTRVMRRNRRDAEKVASNANEKGSVQVGHILLADIFLKIVTIAILK